MDKKLSLEQIAFLWSLLLLAICGSVLFVRWIIHTVTEWQFRRGIMPPASFSDSRDSIEQFRRMYPKQ